MSKETAAAVRVTVPGESVSAMLTQEQVREALKASGYKLTPDELLHEERWDPPTGDGSTWSIFSTIPQHPDTVAWSVRFAVEELARFHEMTPGAMLRGLAGVRAEAYDALREERRRQIAKGRDATRRTTTSARPGTGSTASALHVGGDSETVAWGRGWRRMLVKVANVAVAAFEASERSYARPPRSRLVSCIECAVGRHDDCADPRTCACSDTHVVAAPTAGEEGRPIGEVLHEAWARLQRMAAAPARVALASAEPSAIATQAAELLKAMGIDVFVDGARLAIFGDTHDGARVLRGRVEPHDTAETVVATVRARMAEIDADEEEREVLYIPTTNAGAATVALASKLDGPRPPTCPGLVTVAKDELLADVGKKLGACCPRAGEYNGFGSDGPTTFTCPGHCRCHDCGIGYKPQPTLRRGLRPLPGVPVSRRTAPRRFCESYPGGTACESATLFPYLSGRARVGACLTRTSSPCRLLPPFPSAPSSRSLRSPPLRAPQSKSARRPNRDRPPIPTVRMPRRLKPPRWQPHLNTSERS